VIKIVDTSFTSPQIINFRLKAEGLPDIGSPAYTIGYPMALSGMGKEPKFSDGRISSKMGYNNDLNSFQTTIPVQPGNSGGPVFNEKGELIGLINSKISNADNVSYAIKLNYIRSLLETLPEDLKFPGSNDISSARLEEQVKNFINLVVLIKIKK
jgi:S1-C subfamily serine protease